MPITIYRARDFLSFAEPDDVKNALEELHGLETGDVAVTIQGGTNPATDCCVIMMTDAFDRMLGNSEMIALATHMGASFWRGPAIGQCAHA
jgi:hypothetical protein